jgi:carbamoyl-phosphate synthase large subunit
VIGGIMEHIEQAGIHSGDSACSLPPFSISAGVLDEIRKQTKALAKDLNVIGLVNIQFAVKDETVYIIEVNPRASRTVPFVSKAKSVPLAKLAARVMGGKTLKELGFLEEKTIAHIAVKESVFPFNKFTEVDILLGPEMKSTGEVMGIDSTFGGAFAKSQMATGINLSLGGTVFIGIKEEDKPLALDAVNEFIAMGFDIMATPGTFEFLTASGQNHNRVRKVEKDSPEIFEAIQNKTMSFMINTVFGEQAIKNSLPLRRASLNQNLPFCTTMQGTFAYLEALKSLKAKNLTITTLQEYRQATAAI